MDTKDWTIGGAILVIIALLIYFIGLAGITDKAPENSTAYTKSIVLSTPVCASELLNSIEEQDERSKLKKSDVEKTALQLVSICATQTHRSLAIVAFEALKLEYLKGFAGYLDTAITVSTKNSEKKNDCERAQTVVQAICPIEFNEAFRRIPGAQKSVE